MVYCLTPMEQTPSRTRTTPSTLHGLNHCAPTDQGRIEIRKMWTTAELSGYLNFPHIGQLLSSNASAQIKKTVNTPVKSLMALPAELLNKPTLNACLPPTGVTGASKTAAIILSIGTMTKTAAGYEPAMRQ